MQVTVLYFGVLKDVVGKERETVTVPPHCSVMHLMVDVEGRFPNLASLWSSLAVAVNREYVKATVLLSEGDEVALLPPVSGGCDAG